MKEQYIVMRRRGIYKPSWFYNYYLSKGGRQISIEQFIMIFQTGDFDSILNKIDKEYELTEAYNYNKIWQ